MAKVAVVALFFLFSSCHRDVKAQNTSSCYFCQETDDVCKDAVNVAILPSVRCEELNYIGARSTLIEENGLSAQIRNVMVNSVEPRLSSNIERSYQCIKVAVTGGVCQRHAPPPKVNSTDSNGSVTITEGVLRTCVVKAEDVSSTCDFLREETTSNYTITYCDVCEGDKCNGSAHPSVSALLGVVTLTLMGLLFGCK